MTDSRLTQLLNRITTRRGKPPSQREGFSGPLRALLANSNPQERPIEFFPGQGSPVGPRDSWIKTTGPDCATVPRATGWAGNQMRMKQDLHRHPTPFGV